MPENYNNFQEKFNLSDETLEGAYNIAYNLYKNEKYKDAQNLFYVLTMLNPLKKKFLMGFAAASQLHGDYEKALEAYAMAGIMDGDDPYPHFYAAECYSALNNSQEMLKALQAAEERNIDANLKHKIPLLKETL